MRHRRTAPKKERHEADYDAKEGGTREKLKAAARRLLAQRGVDAVSVRDIATAAGSRNWASVHYYFRSKEALIRELVVDGAKRINQHRNAMLDEAEASGRPLDVRTVARILITTSFANEAEGAADEVGYIRFITTLQLTHRALFIESLENRWNSGYMRCLAHFRLLLAAMPAPILEQRLRFMALYLGATLSSRESALRQQEKPQRLWDKPFAVENLVDTVCGILQHPMSAETADALADVRPKEL